MIDRIEKINELLIKTPDDNFLKHALALEYIKIENDKEARKLFEEILTQDENYLGSYYHLAKLLERNNETASAISYYEKGMEVAKKANENRAYNELKTAYEDLVY
jgi:Tfp pilus assembly protein PilF